MKHVRISTRLWSASGAMLGLLLVCGAPAYFGLHGQRVALDGIIGRFDLLEASSAVTKVSGIVAAIPRAASAAAELSSQSEELSAMVGSFRLDRSPAQILERSGPQDRRA